MKRMLIGIIMLLSLSLVGCSSEVGQKEIELTEAEVNQIVDNRECTEKEFYSASKFLAEKMYNLNENYMETVNQSENMESTSERLKYLSEQINNYRDDLSEIEFCISKFLTISITDTKDNEKLKKIRNNIFLLMDLNDHYQTILDSQIEYVWNNNEDELNKSKDKLEEALKIYNEIMNL